MQKWAAIITKAASDCVAGLIEGSGDRIRNIRLRIDDYDKKSSQLFDSYAKIELLMPEEDVLKLLDSPQVFAKRLRDADRHLAKELAVNALDLLHIWWRQPRAASAMKVALSRNERGGAGDLHPRPDSRALRQGGAGEAYLRGLGVGRRSAPLKFYQEYSGPYLEALRKLQTA